MCILLPPWKELGWGFGEETEPRADWGDPRGPAEERGCL